MFNIKIKYNRNYVKYLLFWVQATEGERSGIISFLCMHQNFVNDKIQSFKFITNNLGKYVNCKLNIKSQKIKSEKFSLVQVFLNGPASISYLKKLEKNIKGNDTKFIEPSILCASIINKKAYPEIINTLIDEYEINLLFKNKKYINNNSNEINL